MLSCIVAIQQKLLHKSTVFVGSTLSMLLIVTVLFNIPTNYQFTNIPRYKQFNMSVLEAKLNHSLRKEKDKNIFEITLEHCPRCKRRIKKESSENENANYSATTCGKDAFARGFGQKVISFTYFGDLTGNYSKTRGFFEGIKENLDLLEVYYPGWIMRVFFDVDKSSATMDMLCQLACQYDYLDLCDVSNLPGTPRKNAKNLAPMIWRFFPSLDPQVDLLNSRDLDSRFSDRELAAVNEWLSIGATIHAMRDHPWHNVPMLGGMWGTDLRRNNSRKSWEASWKKILASPVSHYREKPWDQNILAKYIWPWGRDDAIHHDSFFCNQYPGARAFPTRRKTGIHNFVGYVDCLNRTVDQKCPKACRPKEHQDWEYC